MGFFEKNNLKGGSMEYIYFAVGVFLGMLAYRLIYFKFCPSGTIKIDTSNPEKDIYRFDINDPEEFYNLSKSKYVIFKVIPNSKLSRD